MATLNVRIITPTDQRNDIVNDNLFKQLLAATPAQIDAYLLANMTNIAQARTFMSLALRSIRYLVGQIRT